MFHVEQTLATGLAWIIVALAATTCQAYGGQTTDPESIAVFQCELFDTSGDITPKNLRAQPRRLDAITTILRQSIDDSDVYEIVDVSKVAQVKSPYARFAADGLFSECGGCESEVAALLGADLSMGCLVQKVSNLILNLNLYMRDAKSGNLVELFSASIRGNDDKSWRRSMQWLIKNRVFEPPNLRLDREKRLRGEG